VKNESDIYAIKFETRGEDSLLIREIKVFQKLKNEEGFPQLIDYGKIKDKNFAVMTNLGQNLEQVFKKMHR
jgi:predicted Ser/Thr protein kinase